MDSHEITKMEEIRKMQERPATLTFVLGKPVTKLEQGVWYEGKVGDQDASFKVTKIGIQVAGILTKPNCEMIAGGLFFAEPAEDNSLMLTPRRT